MERRGRAPLLSFRWKGWDGKHRQLEGFDRASSESQLRQRLKTQGIQTVSVTRGAKRNFILFKPRLEVAEFFSSLHRLLSAGVPLLKALFFMVELRSSAFSDEFLVNLQTDLSQGKSLAESLGGYPKYFDEMTLALLTIGERTGKLEQMLGVVIQRSEQQRSLKRAIQKALSYPLCVVIVALVVGVILLVKVVPRFSEMFSEFQAKLPSLTQWIIDLSQFLMAQGFLLLAWMGVVALMAWLLYRRVPRCRRVLSTVAMKLPVVHRFIQSTFLLRLSSTLAITLQAGLPLLKGLQMAQKLLPNFAHQRLIQEACQKIEQGFSLGEALRHPLFPELARHLILLGEHSGTLEEMLLKISNDYQEALGREVALLTQLLEPALMLVVGGMVGVLVLAMYLPMFQLGLVV